jgi:hypothetical protein
MEFLDMDLKRYMDKVGSERDGLGPEMVKVCYTLPENIGKADLHPCRNSPSEPVPL